MTTTHRDRPSARTQSSRRAPRAGRLRITHAPDLRRYYPVEAIRAGLEGSVLMGFLIGAGGEVERAWVERSSGSASLDRAAIALIHAYRFAPPGQPRRTRMPVTFQLASVRGFAVERSLR